MIHFARPVSSRILQAAAVLAAALCLSPARAEPVIPGVIKIEYGYFCALDAVGEREAEDTVSGVIRQVEDTPQFIQYGPLVPATRGVGFGVYVQVKPEYDGVVLAITENPPMGPNGQTRQTFPTTVSSDEQSYVGFAFERRYELVTGPWRMSAELNGRLIYSVDFLVVDPETMPSVSCGVEVPLS